MYKRSFTLAEVLIALIVVGGAFSFVVPAIRGATYTYRTLQQEGTCQYLADEYFSRALVEYLSEQASTDISTLLKETIVQVDQSHYRIVTCLSPDKEEKEEGEEKFLATLKVIVCPAEIKEFDSRGIVRETKLCVNPQK